MLRAEVRTAVGDLALDVALEVPAGTCLALAGPSGAGKSSVLRAIAGLLRGDGVRVWCGAEVWAGPGVHRAPEQRRCGVVFQDYALFGHLSAWRNVAYPLRGLPRHERRRRAQELLDRLGLTARADARPATLSGGERQRVALARALAAEPAVLLLDEPLSALDARTRRTASGVLAEILAVAGVPTVLVTHDFAEAAELADRVAILDRGRVVQEGTPAALTAAPATAFVADLTGALVLHGVASRAPDGSTLVELDGGGAIRSTDAVPAGPVAVSLRPWDLTLEPQGARHDSSARNHLDATVRRVTDLGGRVRVALDAGQPLAAEVTPAAVAELGLCEGARVTATFKAAATRLVESA